MAQVGEGHGVLLEHELLVLGKGQHVLELADGAVVVVLVVQVDLGQAVVRLGIIRVPLLGALVRRDRGVDIALLQRPFADPEVVLVQDDLRAAGPVLDLLGELDDLFPVAVVAAQRDTLTVWKPRFTSLPSRIGVLPDLFGVHEHVGGRRLGFDLEHRIVHVQHELLHVLGLLDPHLVAHLLVAVLVQHEVEVLADAHRHLRFAVGGRAADPLVVHIDVHAAKRRYIGRHAAFCRQDEVVPGRLFLALAVDMPDHPVADVDLLALFQVFHLGPGAAVLGLLDLEPARLAVSRDLARSRRGGAP